MSDQETSIGRAYFEPKHGRDPAKSPLSASATITIPVSAELLAMFETAAALEDYLQAALEQRFGEAVLRDYEEFQQALAVSAPKHRATNFNLGRVIACRAPANIVAKEPKP